MLSFLTLFSHPGDREDADSYFMHCPEEAQPIVTLLGTVGERGGQLKSGSTLLHYCLQSTVHNSSTRTTHIFPITTYLKNGPRWSNFPSLSPNTQVFITGRIFGVTKENRHLAVISDDIHFLPTLPQPITPSPSSTINQTKRTDRWAQRATPSTPTRPARFLNTDSSPRQTDPHTLSGREHYSEHLTTETDKGTDVTWSEMLDEADSNVEKDSPTSERRSKRPRKTSYADILAQSK